MKDVDYENISIEQIKKEIVPILKKYHVNKAILFGSYADGKAVKNSDIDLYIDTDDKLKGLDFVELLEILVETLGKDVDLIDKSHIEPNSSMLQEIEDGGIVIYEQPEDYS
ncbi:MAG TPA: nucleotidyltransferase domain-containing protein [Clostridiales bacterium]|nr:nucleotidyltransferase domain-containing protein [Clostridiales bacterium]